MKHPLPAALLHGFTSALAAAQRAGEVSPATARAITETAAHVSRALLHGRKISGVSIEDLAEDDENFAAVEQHWREHHAGDANQ